MSNTRDDTTSTIQKELKSHQSQTENTSGMLIKTQSYEDSKQSLLFKRRTMLGGRGQAGVAGFYVSEDPSDNNEYLIKVDDSATCLMEGFACFAESVIPDTLKSSVNFAHAGKANIDSNDEEVAVSIQPKLTGYKPWDVVIAGSKRNPKTMVSFEATNMSSILASIDQMTEHAKNQLAMAIFISSLVGDESLHVGQFMVKTNDNGIITDITRIDFGARERYAVLRQELNDYTHETSRAYERSGQLGKDYISYYLAHPDIKARVMHLWTRNEIQGDQLSEHYKAEFTAQFNNLPESKQKEAIEGVLATINKGAKSKLTTNNPEELAEQMSQMMKTRVTKLSASASVFIEVSLAHSFNQIILKSRNIKDTNIIKNNIKTLVNAQSLHKLLSAYGSIKDHLGKLEPPEPVINILTHLQAKFNFEYAYNNDADKKSLANIIQQLDDLKAKYQVLNELLLYKQHLPLSESAVDKIIAVDEAIDWLRKDMAKPAGQRESICNTITPQFVEIISEIRLVGTVSKGAEVAQRIDQYLINYKAPEIMKRPKLPDTAPPEPPKDNKIKI